MWTQLQPSPVYMDRNLLWQTDFLHWGNVSLNAVQNVEQQVAKGLNFICG